MTASLDHERIAELTGLFTEDELRELLGLVVRDLARALDALEVAIAAEDTDRAREAAHTGRNQALMIGATELAEAFSAAHSALVSRSRELALETMARLHAIWPATRVAIEQIRDENPP